MIGWLSSAIRTESQSWIFTELDSTGFGLQGHALQAGACYVSVFCHAMRLDYTRKLATRYSGVLGSVCGLSAGLGAEADLSRSQIVAPDGLKHLDGKHLDRVVVGTQRLFGPTPYLGGDLGVELGLIAVPEAQLLEPYLGLIAAVAKVTGLMANPLAAVAADGLKHLLEGDAELLTGLSTTWASPRVGAYAVVRAPNSELQRRGLQANGHELSWTQTHSREPVLQPYIVFSVEDSQENPDWMRQPELAASWADLAREVRSADQQRARLALAAFQRTAVMSAALLPSDAARLGRLAEDRVKLAFPATMTGAGPKPDPNDIGELASLPLFADS